MVEGEHRVVHALGELTAEVRGLRRDVEKMEALNDQRHEAASAGRKRLHTRIDTLTTSVRDLEATSASMQTLIDEELKPSSDQIRRWKISGVTMLATVGMVGSFATGVVTYNWAKVMRMFGWG